MGPHLPVAVPTGALELASFYDGVEIHLDTQALATTGVMTETCPHCGHRAATRARWRSFVASGTALFGRVRLCPECERDVVGRGDGKYVVSVSASCTAVLLGAALETPLLLLMGVAALPLGLVVAARLDRSRRRSSIACLSISKERVRLRAPKTWRDVLRREQPAILLE